MPIKWSTTQEQIDEINRIEDALYRGKFANKASGDKPIMLDDDYKHQTFFGNYWTFIAYLIVMFIVGAMIIFDMPTVQSYNAKESNKELLTKECERAKLACKSITADED